MVLYKRLIPENGGMINFCAQMFFVQKLLEQILGEAEFFQTMREDATNVATGSALRSTLITYMFMHYFITESVASSFIFLEDFISGPKVQFSGNGNAKVMLVA